MSSPVLADHEEQDLQDPRRCSNFDTPNLQPLNGVRLATDSESPSHSVSIHWWAESIPEMETIAALVEIYFEVVYPM